MPSHVTQTSSSGSGKARVYREEVRPSRSPSVYSPASSDSHSSSSFSEWTQVEVSDDDDIEPSESASHPPRHHQSSRRHHTEAPTAPRPSARRTASRQVYPDEEPSRHRSRQHRSSRHQSHEAHDSRERREHREHREHREQREPRRQPSNGSSSGTAELAADDYPFGRHGGPAQFPPIPAFRHGAGPIPSSHGGYPPSMPSGQGYPDPFPPQGALVHRPHEPFGYPQQGNNPFAGPPSQNPFSPHQYANPESYFQPDSQHPQMNHHQRPPGPSHRSSMYGPAPGSVYSGSEMVPSPYGYPGMAGMPPHMMQGYPMQAYQYPPSHHASPPPPATTPAKEEEKPAPKEVVVEKIVEVEKKDESMAKEVEALRAMIKQQEDARIAREEAIIAAEVAKKRKAEEDALKASEIAAASAAAKAEAEKAAEDAAKKAKEESDKKLAEAEAAKAELEKKQKELEEAVAKNKPTPDMEAKPIKFKDAVGRKFSFPWHLCKSWKGMESLIKQAFLHVDVIGQHVQEGHYDLMGPDGEIILPQVWDTMIKPDWEVSMHMWPIPETPKKEKKEKPEDEMIVQLDPNGQPMNDIFAGMSMNDIFRMDAANQAAEAKAAKKGKNKDKAAKAAKRTSAHVVDVPPAPPAMATSPQGAGFVGMPPHLQQAMFDQGMAGPMVMDIGGEVPVKPKPKKKKELSGFAAWMAGQPPKSKKDDEKLELSTSNHSSHSHSQTLYAIPIAGGNAIARRRRSTAGSSWTTASASTSPPAKVVATAEQGSCAVM